MFQVRCGLIVAAMCAWGAIGEQPEVLAAGRGPKIENQRIRDWSAGGVTTQIINEIHEPIDRVINGTPTNGFPEVGLLEIGSSLCTATLITPEWVLTAAHCVSGASPNQVKFKVNGGTYNGCLIFVHPNFKPFNILLGYDIALVRLATPVTGVTPAAIQSSAPFVGQVVTIVGYGLGGTGDTGGIPGTQGIKRMGDVTIDQVDPLLVWWNFDTNDESNTCSGDSGGPQFNTDGAIVSITSGGFRAACDLGDQSFNTRCDVFISWIQQTIADNPNPNCGGGGPCPLVAALERQGGDPVADVDLDAIRGFRDDVLQANDAGRKLTHLYYQHGAELTRILAANPLLTARVLDFVSSSAPTLEAARSGDGVVHVPEGLWERGLALLTEVEGLAGEDLRTDLGHVRTVLNGRSEHSGSLVSLQFSIPDFQERTALVQFARQVPAPQFPAMVLSGAFGLGLCGWRLRRGRHKDLSA